MHKISSALCLFFLMGIHQLSAETNVQPNQSTCEGLLTDVKVNLEKLSNDELKSISLFVDGLQKLLQKIVAPVQHQKVLVVAPHPDDDILGCGGSIAKHIKNGHTVSIVYMTSGDAGSLEYSKEDLVRIREQEATNAEHMLGVTNLHFLRNFDGWLSHDQKTVIQLIELIRQEQPDIVYVPHHADAHNDHVITHELVVEAITKAGWRCFQECKGDPWCVKTILCYEVWTPLQQVSYFEDISGFMELKLRALRQHTSQLTGYKYDDGVEGLNLYRGSMNRTGRHCEAFQILKMSNEDLAAIVCQ
jgi:N-acetylglucosamine malate deacetylase 1